MTIDHNDFINQVAAMREKQIESSESWPLSPAARRVIRQEATALEQNIDRLLKVHAELQDGQA